MPKGIALQFILPGFLMALTIISIINTVILFFDSGVSLLEFLGNATVIEFFGALALFWLAVFCFLRPQISLLLCAGESLVIVRRLIGFSHRRRFRWNAISNIAPTRVSRSLFYQGGFWWEGCIRFDYQGRTVYIAKGLDEANARPIVDHLRQWLQTRRVTAAQAGSS